MHSEQGASTVEFAVVASLLLLILFGIIELGLTFFQKHYVSHIAREGLRIGVIANNYNCFGGISYSDTCTNDRKTVVMQSIQDDLATFYESANIEVQSPETETGNDVATRKPLIVTVTVKNFMPSIISGFVPGYTRPETIHFTVTGDYEDSQEP